MVSVDGKHHVYLLTYLPAAVWRGKPSQDVRRRTHGCRSRSSLRGGHQHWRNQAGSPTGTRLQGLLGGLHCRLCLYVQPYSLIVKELVVVVVAAFTLFMVSVVVVVVLSVLGVGVFRFLLLLLLLFVCLFVVVVLGFLFVCLLLLFFSRCGGSADGLVVVAVDSIVCYLDQNNVNGGGGILIDR